jgi:PAT family beta-lactamase induction signal transducer AmpG
MSPFARSMSRSARTRFAVATLLYFAQGIPKGLLQIAMPAWLASQGLSAYAIASYLALVILPWVFKLLTGPLMDRYQYPAMGLRRPWVLGAQLGMALSLCLLTWVDDPINQMTLLTAIAVFVNIFAATQDVAVDGMAIDLVPESEQGRINAFMSCGKAVGWAASAALSGVMLGTVGLGTTALLGAGVSFLVFLLFLGVREREGERFLPWTSGKSVAPIQNDHSLRLVIRSLNGVLWTRSSIVVFLVLFFYGLISGYGDALMPIAAIQLFQFTPEQWSGLVASMGLIGAFLALGIGPLIDRFGVKRISILALGLVGAHAMLLALTEFLWVNELYVQMMLSLWVLLDPAVMVCMIAIAMSICTRGVSATQFAVYMSAANLGASSGSKLYGLVSEQVGFVQSYFLLAGLLVFTLCILVMFRRPQDRSDWVEN